jgi:hypothetical protein
VVVAQNASNGLVGDLATVDLQAIHQVRVVEQRLRDTF